MAQMTMVSDTLATIHTEYSGIVTVDEEGTFIVDCRDGPTMITAGAMYVQQSQAERAKARKERQEELAKASEEFAKSSEEDSRREAILSGVMDPEPARSRAAHPSGPGNLGEDHPDRQVPRQPERK